MELVALSWIGVSYFQNNQLASAVLYGFGWFIVGIVNVYAQTISITTMAEMTDSNIQPVWKSLSSDLNIDSNTKNVK